MYRKNNYFVVFYCILILSSIAVAQESGETVLTQEEAVREALKNNPNIIASLNRLEESKTLTKQAREFAPTSIDFDFDQQQNLFSPDEVYFGISQEIEFPTRNAMRMELAKAGISTAKLEHREVRWQSIVVIKLIYQQLSCSQNMVELARENLEMAEAMGKMAEDKYSLGSVGKLDVLRAKVAKANARDELQALIREHKVLEIKLNYLIGNPLEAAIVTSEFKPGLASELKKDELLDTALKSRIELRVLQARMTEKKLEADLTRSLYYPDFSVGINRHSVYQEADTWDTTFSVSVPIFGRGSIDGQIARITAERKTLDTLLIIANKQISAEVISAFEELAHIHSRLQMFREVIITTATEALEIANASYAEGEIGNLELMEVKRTYTEAKINLLQVTLEYNETLIKLESAIGTELVWK